MKVSGETKPLVAEFSRGILAEERRIGVIDRGGVLANLLPLNQVAVGIAVVDPDEFLGESHDRSAGLFVTLMLAAVRAELLQLQPVGIVAAVLLGDVVAVLAHLAGKVILGRTSVLEATSTALFHFSIWSGSGGGLDPRPHDYESCALTS